MLDVCAGSGCIGVSVARLTGAKVVSVDIHSDCCALTEENAVQNAVHLDVRRGDLFAPLDDKERFDLDGLVFYRRIAADYRAHLKKDGVLLLEIGFEQAAAVSAMFDNAELLYDYAERPRALQIENTNSDWKDKR